MGLMSILAPAAAGIVGGLFGGGKNKQSVQASADLNQSRRLMTLQEALGGRYDNLATTAGQDFTDDNNGYRQAVSNEADYLRQNPFTDQYDAAALDGANSGAADAYQRANAQLTASLASRGLNNPGDSSFVGGETAIGNAQAAQQATAQNALAQTKIQTANNNRLKLADLLGGEASTDYGRETGAMGAEGGIDSNLASDYSSLGTNEYNQGQQQQSGLLSTLGGLASTAGDIYAQSQASKAPRPSTIKPMTIKQALTTPTYGKYGS